MSALDGIRLSVTETMSGVMKVGTENHTVRLDLHLLTLDLAAFLHGGEHRAEASGTIRFDALGGTHLVQQGAFYLYRPDPNAATYHLIYHFDFDGPDGRYTFHGEKTLDRKDDTGPIDDMTRLEASVFRTDQPDTIVASGELRFDLEDLPAFISSVKVENAKSTGVKVAAEVAFLSFVMGTLREEYLQGPLYQTQYENVVVQGRAVSSHGEEQPFFLVTGVHDRGFPWGDGEVFWDVLLLLGDGSGGYRRYAITDRYLPGMNVDVAHGLSQYKGPFFEIPCGRSSFSHMKKHASELVRCDANIDLRYETHEHNVVALPFRTLSAHLPTWTTRLFDTLHNLLPGSHPLGIWITPHAVTNVKGTIQVGEETWTLVPQASFGEAEKSTFNNVREPPLLYHYVCVIDPEQKQNLVQIEARTMRNHRTHWVEDQASKEASALITRMADTEIDMTTAECRIRPLRGSVPDSSEVAERVVKLRTLLEIDNDHFPTAVFQRNVVEVADRTGRKCLALEEAMRLLRPEPINSDAKATVAAIRDDDKFRALDTVIVKTGFDENIDTAFRASGKAKEDFLVAIKPNFMFSYSVHDPSTFADPELCMHLAKHLRSRGYTKLRVVEAQSSYGEYFDKRSVREVAEYLGFMKFPEGEPLYEVVDLTLDVDGERDFGPHLGVHPVPRTWRDADYRISFAKNKTHAYAYYTLTLKNIYGALPLGAKYHEYHVKRDIYHTTMEYLAAFPVNFGFIDAYLSADGPFGVFADPLPNLTHTVLGGNNLVAVDWVGATKMGLDPLESPYMQLAVERFGKPEIEFIGDESAYRPWLNVPPLLTEFTNDMLDKDFGPGNMFYALTATLDSKQYTFKDHSLFYKYGRVLTKPFRDAIFVQTGEGPSIANRILSWVEAKLGE